MLEQLLDQMRGIVHGDGQDKVERFFAVDNQFHDMVSQMGKNPLADKISRVVRTLTHAVRYETVSTMINTGRGEAAGGPQRPVRDPAQPPPGQRGGDRPGHLFQSGPVWPGEELNSIKKSQRAKAL